MYNANRQQGSGPRELIATAIRRALEAQFPGYSVAPIQHARIRGSLVGMIGVRNGQTIGSGGIAISRATAISLLPELDESTVDLQDWVGELANQTLGRMKGQLGSRACSMRTSTPVIMDYADLMVRRTNRLHVYQLNAPHHEIIVWIGLELPETANLCAGIHADAVAPGEVLLF